MSIADLEVNMNGIFAHGQAYVALSRATDLNRLAIKGYKKTLILANRDVCRYYEDIIASQQNSKEVSHTDDFAELIGSSVDIEYTETSLNELWIYYKKQRFRMQRA